LQTPLLLGKVFLTLARCGSWLFADQKAFTLDSRSEARKEAGPANTLVSHCEIKRYLDDRE